MNIRIVVEGMSEQQILKDIEKMTKGWILNFYEPTGASYEFLKPFWGFKWDGTSENLVEIIREGAKVGDNVKQHICVFKYNGEDKFAWCSWTKQIYDFTTGEYYQLQGKELAKKITNLINALWNANK